MGQHPRLGGVEMAGKAGEEKAEVETWSLLSLLDGDLLRLIVRLLPVEAPCFGGNVASSQLPVASNQGTSGASALVSSEAFAPDGRQLAAATILGRIVLFDYITALRTSVEITCGVAHSIMTVVYVSQVCRV